MANDHRYREYEKLCLWRVLTRGMKALESNGDIEEKTARRYIVGYLSKLLIESDLIREDTKKVSSHTPKLRNQT